MIEDKTLEFLVQTETAFAPEQSDPQEQKYVWSYDITIKNQWDRIVQLLNRYWCVTDMSGRIEEVHGTGVIGLQPLIKPDRQFKYSSYCQLPTPQGTMEGHFVIQDLNEMLFQVKIPKFILSAPTHVTKWFRAKLH